MTGNPIAPHQAETLRDIAHETAEAESRSPRVSWTNGKPNHTDDITSSRDQSEEVAGGFGIDMYSHNQEDALAIAQNGGVSSADDDDLDEDADADLDDDMMDKISSSPSIEDGGFNPVDTSAGWPRRISSLSSLRTFASPSFAGHHSPSPSQSYRDGEAHQNVPCLQTSVSRYRVNAAGAEWHGCMEDGEEVAQQALNTAGNASLRTLRDCGGRWLGTAPERHYADSPFVAQD